MNHPDTILNAFRDELEKISAAGLGKVRIGSPTVSVANALQGKGRFFKGISKISTVAPPGKFGYKALGGALASGAVLGAVGLHKGKKVVEDYQTGRAVRQAQSGGDV